METTAREVETVEQAIGAAAALLARDPAAAERRLAAAIERSPDHVEACLLKAVAIRRQGRADEARALLEPLAAAHPGRADIRLEIGLALADAGQGDAAIGRIADALALDPRLEQGWPALDQLYRAAGRDEEAAAARRQADRGVERSAGLRRAMAAFGQGRPDEALAVLQTLTAEQPDNPVAASLHAEILIRTGRFAEAEAQLRALLERAPRFHAMRRQLAEILLRAGRGREALLLIADLRAAGLADAGLDDLEAACLLRLDDYGRAIALYRERLERRPEDAGAWVALGELCRITGDSEGAAAALRQAIAREPGRGEAWWSLANLETLTADELAQLEREADAAPPDARVPLLFALGKAAEDGQRHAEAFAFYAEGNRLKRQALPYNREFLADQFARSKAFFDSARLAAAATAAEAEVPIFILGLPRAGSTLVEQILASHPGIEATRELPFIAEIAARVADQRRPGDPVRYPERLAAFSAEALAGLGADYLARCRAHRAGATRLFIDKQPNNYFHIGLIRMILPQAKIVDARRHPMACGFANFKQYYPNGHAFSYDLADIAHHYRDYADLIAHFDAVDPAAIHRLCHERLVDDLEGETRALLDYLGLPFDAACLNFHASARPVRTASAGQVRRPLSRAGVDQWRHFEPWLGPLREALGGAVDEYERALR